MAATNPHPGSIEALLVSWLIHLQALNLSPRTIDNYLLAGRQLAEHLNSAICFMRPAQSTIPCIELITLILATWPHAEGSTARR